MSEAAKTKKEIFLESSTKEFEIVEFTLGTVNYGIPVANVREVIHPVPVTQLPNTHPYIDGIFTLRGQIMPLVNLSCCLGVEDREYSNRSIIISQLNNYFVGFLVNEVSRIHRVSCYIMESPPDLANSESVLSIIKIGDKIVILLDFEKIVAEFNPQIHMKSPSVLQNSSVLQNISTGKGFLA